MVLTLNHTNLAILRNVVDCERLVAVRVYFQIPSSFWSAAENLLR